MLSYKGYTRSGQISFETLIKNNNIEYCNQQLYFRLKLLIYIILNYIINSQIPFYFNSHFQTKY